MDVSSNISMILPFTFLLTCASKSGLTVRYAANDSLNRALYFSFNLALTLYNKIALNVFPYPWSLTAIHSLCAAVGCYFCEKRGYFKSSVKLGQKENLILFAFSALYTVNIAVSNVSLNLVSVPLHQVIRSLTPLFTIILSLSFFGKSFKFMTYMSLVPVIVGVALAT